MKYTLLGYRPYEFDDREGKQVKGVSLYVMYEDQQITGHATEKISVKTIPSNINDCLGGEIDVDFNKQGRVVQIDWGSRPVAAVAAVAAGHTVSSESGVKR